jgi:hypothetical protein
MKCIKDWYYNDNLVFKKGWTYPTLDEKIDGDRKIIGYKIASGDIEDEDTIGIWFWSGSEYFDIPFLI